MGGLQKGLKVSEQGKWYSVPKDNAENGNNIQRERGKYIPEIKKLLIKILKIRHGQCFVSVGKLNARKELHF